MRAYGYKPPMYTSTRPSWRPPSACRKSAQKPGPHRPGPHRPGARAQSHRPPPPCELTVLPAMRARRGGDGGGGDDAWVGLGAGVGSGGR